MAAAAQTRLTSAASASADVARIEAALADGADPAVVGPDGSTLLHTVACVGDNRGAEAVAALVAAGTPVDAVTQRWGINPPGWTALMTAAADGNRSVVRALLDAGADPNLTADTNGFNPLAVAVEDNRSAIAKLLLERGAAPSGPGVTVESLKALGIEDANTAAVAN
eukprot:m.453279 g.453279  ORF g.453279 m.453279 type:complete len:167 (-) comp20472_c0_seq1:3422-3922(-)